MGELREACRARTEQALAALDAALLDSERAVPAAKLILEYGYGKPMQPLEVPGGVAVTVTINRTVARKP